MFVVRLNKGTGKQIRNIKVICEDFARHRVLDALGGESVARQHIHLGIQRRDDIIESVPANRKRVVFVPRLSCIATAEREDKLSWSLCKGEADRTILRSVVGREGKPDNMSALSLSA